MTKALLHELGKSLSFGRLSLKAKVLWPMLLASSDDQGRGLAESDAIKWYVCPNVAEIAIDDIAPLLGEMEQQGMIAVYGTSRGLVYQIVRWWEYQDLQWARPSKYDAPNDWTDRIRYSNRGDYFADKWDATGGFSTESKEEPAREATPEPVNQVENHLENQVDFQPNLTQPNLTQPNLTQPILQDGADTPENPQTKEQEIADFYGSSPVPETPSTETDKQTYLEQLQQAAGGDPVAGAAFIAQTAQAEAWTVPASAGGADPWERVADAFCCLHGLRLGDMPPKKRDQWPRKLENVAALARASPAQMIEAIRAIPDSDYAFKVSGAYSTPYARSFENDIIMLVAQIATGQDVRAKGNGNGSYKRNNGSSPPPGGDSLAEIQRKLASAFEEGQ